MSYQTFLFVDSSCDNIELSPEEISINPVGMSTMVDLQRQMSKATWRPSPGRNMSFTVLHGDKTIGLIHFSSPVINLGPRDKYLKLSLDPVVKGGELRHYVDMSVCVGVQPLAWFWNIGKLVALIATTLGDYYEDKYRDELKGIITTSLWGKGTQYNRVYKLLGYTKGYGHEHISDEEYHKMKNWLLSNGHGLTETKTNVRMGNIQRYKRFKGDKTISLIHGKKRGIYYREAVDPKTRGEVIDFWYNRWGLPRYERKKGCEPPYETGKD